MTVERQGNCPQCGKGTVTHLEHRGSGALIKQPVRAQAPSLAGDAAARKQLPMFNGLIGYFPNACAAVAHVSKVGNDQHNPGQPMHWAFDKSIGTGDDILRHLAERGTFDTDGLRHTAKAAWRAFELLERELLAAHPELKPGVNVRGFTRPETGEYAPQVKLPGGTK